MDIFLTDPTEIPLPPQEVRILQLKAAPLDERRVRVYLEISPSQKHPNIELAIQDEQGHVLASASIIESMQRRIELVMHLRGGSPDGACWLLANLFFVSIPTPPANVDAPDESRPMFTDSHVERLDVDQAKIQIKFT